MNQKIRAEICDQKSVWSELLAEWKTALTTPEWRHSRRSGVFIVNFYQISQ